MRTRNILDKAKDGSGRGHTLCIRMERERGHMCFCFSYWLLYSCDINNVIRMVKKLAFGCSICTLEQ